MERNRCKICGTIYDPKEENCPECGSKEKETLTLPSEEGWDD